jgi:hypothetical protein
MTYERHMKTCFFADGEISLLFAEFDPMSTVSGTLCHAGRMLCVSSIFKESRNFVLIFGVIDTGD